MVNQNKKVFVSFSHQDRFAVEPLIHALKDKHVEYWADQEIRVGEDWAQRIETALNSASVFLLFISPNFLASKWAMFEIGLALGRAKESNVTIIPVLLRDSVLPESFQKFQHLDARSLKPTDFAEKIQQIVERSSEPA